MAMALPEIMQDVEVTVYDFNSGAQVGVGKSDVSFVKETDHRGGLRNRFRGEFRPATKENADGLRAALIRAFSSGGASHTMLFDHEGHTYSLTVKFELGDETFPFTGRAEPKIV
jgi:hypothetical protein